MGESLHSRCTFLQGENDNLREQVTRLEKELLDANFKCASLAEKLVGRVHEVEGLEAELDALKATIKRVGLKVIGTEWDDYESVAILDEMGARARVMHGNLYILAVENGNLQKDNVHLRAELDRAREEKKEWELQYKKLRDAGEWDKGVSPAPVSPEAEKVCVWEQVGHTNEDGNPEVIWRGECGEECDVKPNRTTCDKCQRPIQLAEWE